MMAIERLEWLNEKMTPAGDLGWWFDGRDIFHKKPGTNIDQVIIPLGHLLSDTYTADGQINAEDAFGLVIFRNTLPELIAMMKLIEDWRYEHWADVDFDGMDEILAALDRKLSEVAE